MTIEFISTTVNTEALSLALRLPPSWTRLEPQTTGGDPSPGLEARVHDPLWLLCRQWQLGEFEGEDAGTPLTVRVVTRSVPVDRWAPGLEGAAAQPLGPTGLLEPLVEAEPADGAGLGPGLRPRAEAGMVLLAAVDEAADDPGTVRAALLERCPLDLDPAHHPGGAAAALDPVWVRLARLLAGRPVLDGEAAAAALELTAPDLPDWLPVAGDGAALRTATADWLAWYRSEISPTGEPGTDAWVGSRLEYRFRIGAGATTLAAPQHGGGEIGWPSFRAADVPLDQPDAAPPPAPSSPEVHALLASPLRYPGMPADRLWEFEDQQVNLGAVEAEPWTLARLLLTEFALGYGNDWLVVPVDVPVGSLTTIDSVLYVTTFGERFVVRPTAEVSPDGHWRMFAISTGAPAQGPGGVIDGLLVPPGALAVQDGPAAEEVLFLRDEMANLAWAVERVVLGPSGTGRDRSRENDGFTDTDPGPVATAALDYLLATAVPARWIPYLPRSSGYRAIDLVQGAMPDATGVALRPLGRLLNTAGVRVIEDAEIPREGVQVRRQPSLTRSVDGHYVRWTTRRVRTGRGEGASNLAFDSARPRKPRPNRGGG